MLDVAQGNNLRHFGFATLQNVDTLGDFVSGTIISRVELISSSSVDESGD